MARGWHGNSDGHARAGQLGGKKSAENRRKTSQFGEQLTTVPKDFDVPPLPREQDESKTPMEN